LSNPEPVVYSCFNSIPAGIYYDISLKAGIVEPEETPFARQRLGKRVSTATDTQVTTEELLETVFSIRPVQSGYKEEFC
jgi:hypothetical protein